MTFSGQHNNISRFSVMDGIGDGLLPVNDLHILSAGFRDSRPDIVDDGLGLLIPGIVGGDDGQIRQPAGNLSHLKTPLPGPVAAAAEKAHQPVGMILPQSGQQAFQAHGVVGVIDHQRKFIGNLHHLNASLHLRHLQSPHNILLGYLKMTADGDGCQGIIDTEPSRQINFHREIHQSLHLIGNSQHAFSGNQPGTGRPQICLR